MATKKTTLRKAKIELEKYSVQLDKLLPELSFLASCYRRDGLDSQASNMFHAHSLIAIANSLIWDNK